MNVLEGRPQGQVAQGLPIRLNGTTYAPGNNYALVKLFPEAKGIAMTSKQGITLSSVNNTKLGFAKLESIEPNTSLNGETITGEAIINNQFAVQLSLPNPTPGNALRVTVPRGALPQQWWVDWDRRDPQNPDSNQQTDGLLLLMSNLSKMLVEPGSTPAVSYCLMYSN